MCVTLDVNSVEGNKISYYCAEGTSCRGMYTDCGKDIFLSLFLFYFRVSVFSI